MNDTPSTWAMTARVTISRRPQDAADDVRMECSWDSPSTASSPMSASNPSSTPTTARSCYGFQRGDITFSTRPAQPVAHSPGSYASLPGRRAAAQPYSRRCKSTCNITLAEVRDDETGVQVTRSNSLNAQDVTCVACGARRSPTAQRRSGVNYTTHFCTRVPDKGAAVGGGSRDVASQTLDAEVPADAANMSGQEVAVNATIVVPKVEFDSAPGGWVQDSSCAKPVDVESRGASSMGQKVARRPEEQGGAPAANDSLDKSHAAKTKTSPSLLKVPLGDEDGLNQPKCPPRLSRSPARLAGRSPLLRRTDCAKSSRTDSSTTPRKPRTVHIDVYCTASEASDSSTSSSTSSSSSEGSWSSPRTVFESPDTRIVHTRADRAQLPLALLRRSLRAAAHERNAPPPRGYDSDDGLSSVCTSRDPSSSTLSSTMSGVDTCDSATATSWKDTATQSRTSLLSGPSIAGSDSFEYADSSDRLRIRERERAWAAQETFEGKSWRSPGAERRLVLQQQRFKEFLEKRLSATAAAFPLRKAPARDESEEDDDGDSDETGDAWTFASPRACALKREDTVRRATPTQSVVAAAESAAASPVLMTPFTERAGLRTERLSCAERFGEIVGALRRPGHHVGPAKNPECGCAHCRAYCVEIGYRARTRSLDAAAETADNWKAQLANQLAQRGARKAGGGESWDSNEV